jgi:competence protein ComEC
MLPANGVIMRIAWFLLLTVAFADPVATFGAERRTSLDIYAVDVEGGQAVLFVSPTGESLLVDAANPGERDAGRIAAAAKEAGVKQIDYLVITHFHRDHFGGVPDLVTRLPIRNFVDHGLPVIETTESAVAAFQAYAAVRDKGRHMPVKPGDKIPIKGLDVQVVTAGGAAITNPLRGGGAPNPLCRDFMPQVENEPAKEDGRSVGIIVRLGRFSASDVGDLTWNKEFNLVCPNNLLGTVDLHVTNRHGITGSGSPTFVHALKPRIALFDNGPQKGASREPFLSVKSSPGLENIWQLHYSVARPARALFGETTDQGGKDLNTPEPFIANLDEEHTTAYSLKISAQEDGSFSVTNQRTGYTKEYKPRR